MTTTPIACGLTPAGKECPAVCYLSTDKFLKAFCVTHCEDLWLPRYEHSLAHSRLDHGTLRTQLNQSIKSLFDRTHTHQEAHLILRLN
jgi:hypothetical protein